MAEQRKDESGSGTQDPSRAKDEARPEKERPEKGSEKENDERDRGERLRDEVRSRRTDEDPEIGRAHPGDPSAGASGPGGG